MRKPVGYSGASCTCDVCGRVLWVEDGPVCVDCKALQEVVKDAQLLPQDAEPEPEPAPKPAPKKRSSGCCG